MIELYLELGNALAQVSDLQVVDAAPRPENYAAEYPAAFVSIDKLTPKSEATGCLLDNMEFTIELWISPSVVSRIKPETPGQEVLTEEFAVVNIVRDTVETHSGELVFDTYLKSEEMLRQDDGLYKITQKWQATSLFVQPEPPLLTDIPELSLEYQYVR